jgi:zinc transporter 9
MGILVGTSLIVIIPEGIEAVYATELLGHTHGKRSKWLQRDTNVRWANHKPPGQRNIIGLETHFQHHSRAEENSPLSSPEPVIPTVEVKPGPGVKSSEADPLENGEQKHEPSPPTFYVGLSLILGFVLMFLIDKLPRHASETLQAPPPTRHISLNNLAQGLHESPTLENGEDSESFLQSLTPSPKQTRSLATTTGLVIHAAADGIAMGASASTSNMSLGFIIFVAIMVHKAPAAFGLTSVLLKQGLSKRAARGHLIIFSLAAPFGALTTWLVVHLLGGERPVDGNSGQWWTGMLLLFSAGTFL